MYKPGCTLCMCVCVHAPVPVCSCAPADAWGGQEEVCTLFERGVVEWC